MQSHPTPSGAIVGDARSAPAAPIPPAEREVAVLRRMLGALQVEGIEQLREQVRMALVDPSSDPTCRIYVMHPHTPRSSASSEGRTRLDPFPVRTPQGHVVGELAIWVEHGLLRALQYVPHDQRTVLVLPPPEWIELPAARVPAAVRVGGGRQALAGVRAIGVPPVLDAPLQAARPARAPAHRRTPRRGRRLVVGAASAMLLLVVALVGFSAGSSRGVDLSAASADGAAAGTSAGTEHGRALGSYLGEAEGTLAGRVSTYRPAFEAAERRALVAARTAARAKRLKAQRAAEATAKAAAAAPVPVFADNTTCLGYRAASGLWVCS